ncbi:orotidine-5'-phosphate decarboxylase [Candidatus Margulisiibacteriota bacterium]
MLNHPFCQKLANNIKNKNTYVCVGLDPDLDKIPDFLPKNIKSLETFLTEIIEQTQEHCIAYKPNISFFEALGIEGLQLLEKIRKRIPAHIPVILDAKRGDIGNTSKMQAKFIFDYFGADATTLHPYMGIDSLEPFFNYKDKFNFILALTSNPSAKDFEKQLMNNKKPLYEFVTKNCSDWNKKYQNIGLVVGATQDELQEIRKIDTALPFLIPGVGAQGGDYETAVNNGTNEDGIVIINMSRGILYCSNDKGFGKIVNAKIRSLKCLK